MRSTFTAGPIAAVAFAATTLFGCHTGPPPRWPESLCDPTPGSVFRTTTMNDAGTIRVEPSPSAPVGTAEEAYRAYLRVAGAPTREQAPQLQVRFGLLTDSGMEISQLEPIGGGVPIVRRLPLWVISACNAPYQPPNVAAPPGVPPVPSGGELVVGIDPSRWISVVNTYRTGRSTSDQPDDLVQQPPPEQTPYRSTPWTLSHTRDGRRRLLLRYRTARCMALDHVEAVTGSGERTTISVILSGPAPGEGCPPDSADAPFAEANLDQPATSSIKHGRTGRVQFHPVRN